MMKKALSITLMLAVCMATGAFAKPVDQTGSLDKLEFLDLNPQFDAQAATAGVFGAALGGTTYFGGTYWNSDSSRWEAIEDSCWTFDSGVGSNFNHHPSQGGTNPNVNPFKNTGLHAEMEGWIGFDNSYAELTYFRRLAQSAFAGSDTCVGSGAGLGGEYSFWAGVLPLEADVLCYAGGQGYGDAWVVCIEHGENYNGAGNVNWSYGYVVETEANFDYGYAIVDTSAAGDDATAATYTGFASGTANLTLIPGTTMRSDAGPVLFKFCAVSDGAYSDQDGLNPTACGAMAVDDISITGGGISHAASFEAGADGWSLSAPAEGAGGEWSDIVDLSLLPAYKTNCTCTLSDSVLLFEDLSAGGHGLFQDNLAASPWIDLLKAGQVGAPGKFVQFEGYFELPLLNYIFVQTNVQWYPEVCLNTGKLIRSTWTSDGFVRYFGGVPTCTNPGAAPTRLNYGAVMDAGAEQMRIALGVLSYCRFFANCTNLTNSTPWFDNVKMGLFGNPAAPLLTSRTIDVPQDNFPENGTLRINAAGRIDSNNVKGVSQPETGSSLGDTLIAQGGSGGAQVHVNFAVYPGPGIDAGALATWLGSVTPANVRNGVQWYTARMDTAEQGGTTTAGSWMTTRIEGSPGFSGTDKSTDPGDVAPNGVQRLLNDIFPDNLFTPGTRVELFYRTAYVGTPNDVFTLPDTTIGAPPFEMEILPSSMGADSTWNCVLYVDHFEGRGAQPFIERALTTILGTGSNNEEGTNWDRFDVQAPTSQQMSFGRPLNTEYGATTVQTLAYQAIVWNSGNLSAFNLVKEDADVLIPWLTLLDGGAGLGNSFYGSGDGLARSMNAEAASEPSALQMLNNVLGVSFTCDTVRNLNCPNGSVQDTTACIGLDPTGGARIADSPLRSVSHLAQGNGCPQQRSFDVLGLFGGSIGTPIGDETYDKSGGAVSFASVTTEATGGPDYRGVVDGLSVHYRRDVSDCQFDTSSEAAVVERLNEVMTWFGFVGGATCNDPSANVSVPGGNGPKFVTALQNFAPNPLLSGKGRIQFTMSNEGDASVQIFDVGGRLVKEVFNGLAGEGLNVVHWDGTDNTGRGVSSGVYFYRLKAAGKEFSNKLVVVRNGN